MTLHRVGMTPERLRIDRKLAAIDDTMGLQRPEQDQGRRASPSARRRRLSASEYIQEVDR